MYINLYFLFHSIYLGNHSLPVHRNLLPLLFLQLHSSYYVDVPQFTHLGWSFRLFPYRISQIMLPWITLYTSRLYLWRYILEIGLLGLRVNAYRYCQIPLDERCTILHSRQQHECMFPRASPTECVRGSTFLPTWWVRNATSVIWTCISLIMSKTEHLCYLVRAHCLMCIEIKPMAFEKRKFYLLVDWEGDRRRGSNLSSLIQSLGF